MRLVVIFFILGSSANAVLHYGLDQSPFDSSDHFAACKLLCTTTLYFSSVRRGPLTSNRCEGQASSIAGMAEPEKRKVSANEYLPRCPLNSGIVLSFGRCIAINNDRLKVAVVLLQLPLLLLICLLSILLNNYCRLSAYKNFVNIFVCFPSWTFHR